MDALDGALISTSQELWPQPCTFDLMVDGPQGGKTRLQHTPDLFIIEHGFVIEEWREEHRLQRLATDRPHHFLKDADGKWHYLPVEEHCAKLGIEYRLRSADEHNRVFLSNLSFLQDYSLEDTPVVPAAERERAIHLLLENNRLPHLSMVVEHQMKADHVFQLVLEGSIYVDLEQTLVRDTGALILYRNEAVEKADRLLRSQRLPALPSSALVIAVGSKFLFDNKRYEVALLGQDDVIARDDNGTTTQLSLGLVNDLFGKMSVNADEHAHLPSDFDPDEILSDGRLSAALKKLDELQHPETSSVDPRTRRRWKEKVSGITAVQDQLQALMSQIPGNRTPRLPAAVLQLAEEAVKVFHNKKPNPSTLATYNYFVTKCDNAGERPMSHTAFYAFCASREDVAAREGKRKAYQKAPIPLTIDYLHPVHGVLPHEVCYCDHTIMNVFLKGSVLPDLGKPTITLMVDGALSKPRAFYLSYQPASTVSVLMCLRDYVRRNGRLPRILVLDNGKEFHSEALKLFCSLFGIDIRWRRRSRPRDSTIVERMLGATEKEVLGQLDGNSLALKDPRMVSSTHLPKNNIEWTLPGLHGAVDYFLFDVQPKRIHPRFGVSPNDYEKRLILECGAREHLMVRFDGTLRMLTAPHSGQPKRKVDRQRGVFVDGMYYWHDRLALAKVNEECEVRVELWRASIVYVNFRDHWSIAVARDGGELNGRFRPEFELQTREETRRKKTVAQQDKGSAENSRKRVKLWTPSHWDDRCRDQQTEMYLLYERLGMTEVMPEARNPNAHEVSLRLPRGSSLDAIYAVQDEPDVVPEIDEDKPDDSVHSGAANDTTPAVVTLPRHADQPVPNSPAPPPAVAQAVPRSMRPPEPPLPALLEFDEDVYF